ncbi:uncharacterized protein G2W53_029605 [Senna tora]|uniref:Uncharacterized protein n=1 Tax=Senna tora TaxID=362788 RepID=A0A834T5W1_9FABA|nr:uncharacterized protein G2W53_029605 [Senna tora]
MGKNPKLLILFAALPCVPSISLPKGHRRRKQTKMAKKNEGPSEMKEVQDAATIDDKEVLNNKAEEKEDPQKKLLKDEKETKTTTTSYEDLLNISEDWTAYEKELYDYFK